MTRTLRSHTPFTSPTGLARARAFAGSSSPWPASPVLAFVLALALAFVSAPPALAQDEVGLDELVQKNLAARGGAAAWDAVESAKVEAKMLLGGDMNAPMVFYFADPNKMRTEIDIQGSKIIQGYDGAVGWQILPMFGSSAAQTLGDDELEQMLRQDFFRGLLQSYEAKGYAAEYVGLSSVDGRPAHEIRIVFDPRAPDDDALLYVDAESHFVVRQVLETVSPQTGADMRIEVNADDFRAVGDLVLAHRYELVPEGVPNGQIIVIDSVQVNPDEIDDALFAMPAPPAAPSAESAEESAQESAAADG